MNRRLALLPGIVLLAVACNAGVQPGPTAPAEPPVTRAPDEPVVSVPGIDFPLPGAGGPANVVPKPGQRNVHPVSVELIEARVNGDRIAVRLTWTSGVEPCYVLDSVAVTRDGNRITLTVREGSGPEGVVCIEIAQQKATVVDLGSFEPGTYTIATSDGGATPVEVTVG